MKDDLSGVIDKKPEDMTIRELQFHFFREHDRDGDERLGKKPVSIHAKSLLLFASVMQHVHLISKIFVKEVKIYLAGKFLFSENIVITMNGTLNNMVSVWNC